MAGTYHLPADVQRAAAISLHERKETAAQIAARLNVSEASVYRWHVKVYGKGLPRVVPEPPMKKVAVVPPEAKVEPVLLSPHAKDDISELDLYRQYGWIPRPQNKRRYAW